MGQDDVIELEIADLGLALQVIRQLKKTEDELVQNILHDALKLHQLYHQFSMREEANGEFDRTLVSLLHSIVVPKLDTPDETFSDGAGI